MCIFYENSLCNSYEADTVYLRLMNMKDDSVKVKKLKSYASDYIETNPDFAKKIYTDILSISQKIKNKSC